MGPRFAAALVLTGCFTLGILHAQKNSTKFPDEKEWAQYEGQNRPDLPADFDEIVAKSKQASSMKGNPLPLSDPELHQILAAAL